MARVTAVAAPTVPATPPLGGCLEQPSRVAPSKDAPQAIGGAIHRTPTRGLVVSPGKYRASSGIVIDQPISLASTDLGFQLYQTSTDRSLLVFRNVQAVRVQDPYLDSSATEHGTSLLKLVDTHRSRFESITMLGGDRGVHLQGFLLDTFADLRSGVDIACIFAPTSTSRYCVFAGRNNGVSANANTFITPTLEGGTNGVRIERSNREGNTPDLKLDTDGRIRAKGFETSDILSPADGRASRRVYEDERGLQLEDLRTGGASRILLENGLRPLTERLDAPQREVALLRRAAGASAR